ncbi:hypothetical protein Q7P36_010624 [Cladosporium allicinum]
MEALSSDSPPSLAFLKALPQPNGRGQPKQWAIYVLVFEKAGCPPQIYVGSSTNSQYRVRRRFQGYNSGSGPWSRFTSKAIDDGYTMSSTGLLCWIDLPLPTQIHRQRARLLTLEAVPAINLVAVRPTGFDKFFIDEFYLWPRDAMPWLPLCSHIPLDEGVARNIELTDEELNDVAARRLELGRQRIKRHRKRKRDEDEEAFLQKDRDDKARFNANNPTLRKGYQATTRNKAKAEGRFRCPEADCDYSGKSNQNLMVHQRGGSHLAVVNKTHFCVRCNKAFPFKSYLAKHTHTR